MDDVLVVLSYMATVFVSYWTGGLMVYRLLKKQGRVLDKDGNVMPRD